MAKVSVRYIVDNVDAAIDFYCQELGFHEEMHPADTFAMLSQGDLRLVLSAPGGGPGGGQAMPDGTLPQPGGWNRFQLEVGDLESAVARLRSHGAHFRNDIVAGSAAGKSSSRIQRATRSSCFSRQSPRRNSRLALEPAAIGPRGPRRPARVESRQ